MHNHKIFLSRFWEPTYEDCLNLIARVPVVAAYVYRRLVRTSPFCSLFFSCILQLLDYKKDLSSSVFCFVFTSTLNHCRMYKNGDSIPSDKSLDYGANFSHMLGFDDDKMKELMRLYITIHRSVLISSSNYVF